MKRYFKASKTGLLDHCFAQVPPFFHPKKTYFKEENGEIFHHQGDYIKLQAVYQTVYSYLIITPKLIWFLFPCHAINYLFGENYKQVQSIFSHAIHLNNTHWWFFFFFLLIHRPPHLIPTHEFQHPAYDKSISLYSAHLLCTSDPLLPISTSFA